MNNIVAMATNDERYKPRLSKTLMLLQMAIAKVDGTGSVYYDQFDLADLLWAAHDIAQAHFIGSCDVCKETEELLARIASDSV